MMDFIREGLNDILPKADLSVKSEIVILPQLKL
jgi:hypothetical protein